MGINACYGLCLCPDSPGRNLWVIEKISETISKKSVMNYMANLGQLKNISKMSCSFSPYFGSFSSVFVLGYMLLVFPINTHSLPADPGGLLWYGSGSETRVSYLNYYIIVCRQQPAGLYRCHRLRAGGAQHQQIIR